MNRTPAPKKPSRGSAGGLLRRQPALAWAFGGLGVADVRDGRVPQVHAQVAEELGPALLAQLRASLGSGGSAAPARNQLTLAQLADHITQTHHASMRRELPRLIELARQVQRQPAGEDRRLPAVCETILSLAPEVPGHLEEEEGVLFPLLRDLETGARTPARCEAVVRIVQKLDDEHTHVGAALVLLRSLTNDFRAPETAGESHRELLACLAAFESDLQRHMHKEHHVLFPRAVALATAGTAAAQDPRLS